MKSYIKTLLFLSLSGAILTGCSSDSEPLESGNLPMSFDCRLSNSRATDTEFESGDKIGIFVVKDGEQLLPAGNEVNNESFAFDGTAWKPSRNVFWDEGKFDVFAYYPYSSSVDDTEEYLFTVSEDQSTHAGYTDSDFLWASKLGVAGSASPVPLIFSHSMSKLVIKLEKGEGYDGELPKDCDVFVHSTAVEASVNLETGAVSASLYSPVSSIKALKNSDNEFQAIVVPQNISSRRPLIEVVSGGVSYLMEGKISFHQGYSHNVTVTLSKNPEQTKIEIGGSIGGWN